MMQPTGEQAAGYESKHGSRIAALAVTAGAFALAGAGAVLYTVANWHGINLPPMPEMPIHSPDWGSIQQHAAYVGHTLLDQLASR